MNKKLTAILLCAFLILLLLPVSVLAASSSPEITRQPVNGYAAAGSIVSTSVAAEGDDLQYQWYLKNPEHTRFYLSSMTDATYAVIMTEQISGRQVYCVITDSSGSSVTTDTVTLRIPKALKLTQQSSDLFVPEGETATASVAAEGDALQYQWYLKHPGQTEFSPASVTDAVCSVSLTKDISGIQLRCVVSDCHGNSVTSDTVTFKISTPLKILRQPGSRCVAVGERASTKVHAQGDGLHYQWYQKDPAQEQFEKSSVTTASYAVNMTREISGRQVYCVITDRIGNVVISESAVLEALPPIRILRQPNNGYAFPGENLSTAVEAAGENLQYQWYLKNPGEKEFSQSVVTESTYSVKMSEEMSGRQVYCVITDGDGNTLQTNTVTLQRNGVFEKKLIKMKPDSTKNLAAFLTFNTANRLTWSSSDPAVVTVDKFGTVSGVTYGTATITVTDSVTGEKAQCDVKVCDVKQVALTFDDGPSVHTRRLLDFLRENDITVTFFLVGNRLNNFSETLQQTVLDGHEIAYHSYRHQNQRRLSTQKILSDYEKSNEILKELTGAEFTLWRTPGGNYNDRVIDAVPLPHIMWSVDTRDWQHLNSYKVYRSVVSSKDGAIILMHDLYSSTVDGAIRAMEAMIEGDYEFLTVSELLSRSGTAPENHVTYFSAS